MQKSTNPGHQLAWVTKCFMTATHILSIIIPKCSFFTYKSGTWISGKLVDPYLDTSLTFTWKTPFSHMMLISQPWKHNHKSYSGITKETPL
jgi:hypothetical protein